MVRRPLLVRRPLMVLRPVVAHQVGFVRGAYVLLHIRTPNQGEADE